MLKKQNTSLIKNFVNIMMKSKTVARNFKRLFVLILEKTLILVFIKKEVFFARIIGPDIFYGFINFAVILDFL